MKKRTLFVLVAVLLAGGGALGLLRAYQVELIHMIVVNAVIQKAPLDFPAQRIRSEFDGALNAASQAGTKNGYLGELLDLSRRLEKVQRLSRGDVEDLLSKLSQRSEADEVAGRSQGLLEPVLPWAGEVRALSDRDGPSVLSKLRAYHPVRFCETFPASFATDSTPSPDSFLGDHFFDGCGRTEPGRLETGTASQAPEARSGQRNHSEER